jgi:hypothetical protein
MKFEYGIGYWDIGSSLVGRFDFSMLYLSIYLSIGAFALYKYAMQLLYFDVFSNVVNYISIHVLLFIDFFHV